MPIKQKTFEFSFKEEFYQADVEIQHHTEEDYGADADGNRGTRRTFIDDIKINSITNVYGVQIDITPELSDAILDQVEI